jgi:FkbM family methyltransferase
MPILQIIANPLLRCLSGFLHIAPLKTRLGGVSTITAKIFGLHAFTDERFAILRNGLKLPVRLSDYNGRMLYLFGTPDPKVICVCRTLLHQGDLFLDIGANYGTVGLLSHDVLGKDGAIHFVEPQPELSNIIRDAIQSISIPNAHIHNCGMWDEDGELTLMKPYKHTGAASISDSRSSDSTNGESIRVPVRAIDAFIDEHVGGRPFAAKVDVEGAEPRILPAILAHPTLRFVLFECNIQEVRDHAWELISDKKLAFFGLSKHLFVTRLKAICTRDELERVHDVVAVRMDPDRVLTGEFHPSKLRIMLDSYKFGCPV